MSDTEIWYEINKLKRNRSKCSCVPKTVTELPTSNQGDVILDGDIYYWNGTMYVAYGGGGNAPITEITATGTVDITGEEIFEVTTAAITVTIDETGLVNGDEAHFKNTSGGNITIATSGATTIDGAATLTVVDLDSVYLKFNGTNFIII